jgi:protocatechuate 3,4-dioxygenase beta subunit
VNTDHNRPDGNRNEGVMKSKIRMIPTAVRGFAVATAAALSFGACGLNDEQIPELSGPSTTGTQIRLEALPDVITADGFSTSLIRITVYDQNGTPASGRTIILALANSTGQFADIGTLYSPTGSLLRAAEATVVTDSSGRATAVYTAPPRTDFTADGSITVRARHLQFRSDRAQVRGTASLRRTGSVRLRRRGARRQGDLHRPCHVHDKGGSLGAVPIHGRRRAVRMVLG